LLKGLKTYGIILRNKSLLERSEMRGTKFDLYFPEDLNEFKNNFNMNEAIDYTILCKDDEVVYFHMGSLNIDNYFQIKDIISKDHKRGL
jgi:hypothetical protein